MGLEFVPVRPWGGHAEVYSSLASLESLIAYYFAVASSPQEFANSLKTVAASSLSLVTLPAMSSMNLHRGNGRRGKARTEKDCREDDTPAHHGAGSAPFP